MQQALGKNLAFAMLALVGIVAFVFSGLQVTRAIGTLPIENYVPIVKFNEGIYTTYAITSTAGLTVASIANSGAITNTGAATFNGDVTLGNATTDTVTVGGTASFSGATTTFNGVEHWSQTQAFDTATTTVCSLQSPNATSTLEIFAATFDVSSTTASTVRFAKAANAFATTTTLTAVSVGAGAQATISAVASTTPTGALNGSYVFAPNEWAVIGMEGGTGTFSPTGDCWAEWVHAN